MKKNNKFKTVIIIFASFLLFTMLISICVLIHREAVRKQEAQVKEKAIENASKNGYSIQFDDEKTFCFEEDGVKYYFCIDISGICFDYCKFAVEEENVTLKKGTVILTITDLGDGNVDVDYDDSRVLISDDGTEVPMYGGGYFVSNKDFDKETFVIDPVRIDGKQKSIEAYDTIMKFTTVEDLKEHYNKALSICEQLNEGL